jgi:DNA transposition AAA+ family ATPase
MASPTTPPPFSYSDTHHMPTTKTATSATRPTKKRGLIAAPSEAAMAAPALEVLRRHALDGPVLDHPQLRRVLCLAKLAHRTPGLQVWTGPSGVGKTVTAEQLEFECNREADEEKPGAYRARYFITGGDVEASSGRQMKRGVYCAYEQMVEELTAAELRQRTETSLATDVVEEARLMNTQLIIVDEAGTKTAAEIRGLALICDIARREGWPLSVILVGMDDLAEKATSLHVLQSRTRLTATFEPWDDQECRAYIMSREGLAAALFAAGGAGSDGLLKDLVQYTGGRLRELQTLLPEIEHRLTKGRAPDDAIEKILKWRKDAGEQALKQAKEYSERRRDRHRRRTA